MEFFPSAKVKLAIRLEEFNDEIFNPKDLPPRNAKNLNPAKSVTKPDTLDVVKDPAKPGAFLLVQKGSTKKTPGAGQVQGQSSDGRSHSIAGIIPKSASLAYNWVLAADTLSVTMKWLDCPLDPRLIRSAAIEFYLGAVTPQEYAQGISGTQRQLDNGDGNTSYEPLNLINDTYFWNGAVRTNLRFQGWVDEWKVSMDESGEATVELQCRDNTQLIIDQKAPQKPRIATDKPIDEAIATYLANFPQFEGLAVQYRPTDTPRDRKPTLKDVVIKLDINALGPAPSKGGGGDGVSVWDYLRDCTAAIGLNIRVDGTDILIESPRTLINDKAQPRPEDPYRTREIDGKPYDVRTFIYGQNALIFGVNRNYNSKAPGNIEVRSYYPNNKVQFVARFPEKDDRVVSANPGDGKADQKWKVIKVSHPVQSQTALKRIAESQYYMRNRMEIECEVKTRNLTSFGGDPLDTDILDARPGDSVKLVIDHAAYGSVSAVDGLLDARAQDSNYLLKLGFKEKFVIAYAQARNTAKFPKKFLIKEVKVDWDSESGVDVNLTCINFITARLDTEPPTEVVKR